MSKFPLFPLGRVVATPGATGYDVSTLAVCLKRHRRGDWGKVCAEDKAANESALQHGGRLLSAYEMHDGETLWIITEADRSVTTVSLARGVLSNERTILGTLLPHEQP